MKPVQTTTKSYFTNVSPLLPHLNRVAGSACYISIRLGLIKALSIIGEASGSETSSLREQVVHAADGLLYWCMFIQLSLEKAAANLNSPGVFRRV